MELKLLVYKTFFDERHDHMQESSDFAKKMFSKLVLIYTININRATIKLILLMAFYKFLTKFTKEN